MCQLNQAITDAQNTFFELTSELEDKGLFELGKHPKWYAPPLSLEQKMLLSQHTLALAKACVLTLQKAIEEGIITPEGTMTSAGVLTLKCNDVWDVFRFFNRVLHPMLTLEMDKSNTNIVVTQRITSAKGISMRFITPKSLFNRLPLGTIDVQNLQPYDLTKAASFKRKEPN